jgi:hypothetical protein
LGKVLVNAEHRAFRRGFFAALRAENIELDENTKRSAKIINKLLEAQKRHEAKKENNEEQK